MEITHYGITQANTTIDSTDIAVEEILHNGYTIINNALTVEEVNYYRNSLDLIYDKQCAEVGGEENLSLINDANIVRCPLAYEPTFLDMAKHNIVLQICNRILDNNIMLLMQNGILNHPQNTHYQTSWHRDLNYQHWVCSKP